MPDGGFKRGLNWTRGNVRQAGPPQRGEGSQLGREAQARAKQATQEMRAKKQLGIPLDQPMSPQDAQRLTERTQGPVRTHPAYGPIDRDRMNKNERLAYLYYRDKIGSLEGVGANARLQLTAPGHVANDLEVLKRKDEFNQYLIELGRRKAEGVPTEPDPPKWLTTFQGAGMYLRGDPHLPAGWDSDKAKQADVKAVADAWNQGLKMDSGESRRGFEAAVWDKLGFYKTTWPNRKWASGDPGEPR